MATRSTRNQPFCWQEKKVLRLLRKKFNKSELVKMKSLYLALTEIDSDFNGKPIKFYTKTISTYSGLSVKWIPKALQSLKQYEIIEMVEERDNKGHILSRKLIFTPEKLVEKPNSGKTYIRIIPNMPKPTVRKPASGQMLTLEDSSLKEDSFVGEEKEDGQNGILPESVPEPTNSKKIKSKISTENTKPPKTFPKDSLQYRIAEYFTKKICDRHPALADKLNKEVCLQKAAYEIDRCYRLDKFTFNQIGKIIQWALRDDFWCKQIQSVGYLRKTNKQGHRYINVFWDRMQDNGKLDDVPVMKIWDGWQSRRKELNKYNDIQPKPSLEQRKDIQELWDISGKNKKLLSRKVDCFLRNHRPYFVEKKHPLWLLKKCWPEIELSEKDIEEINAR